MKRFFLTLFLGFLLLASPVSIRAKSIDDQLRDIQHQLDMLAKALAPLESEYNQLQTKIQASQRHITNIRVMMHQLDQHLLDKEADLAVKKIILAQKARRYYINLQKFSPLDIFLNSHSSQEIVFQFGWYHAVLAQNRQAIQNVSQELTRLNQQKLQLAHEKNQLAQLQKKFQQRAHFLAGEISKAHQYRAMLTQKQEELIRQKTEMFTTSVGETPPVQDACAGAPGSSNFCSPGFRPAFAAFSFGAPHRKGMSQYGAYGRAKKGQDYQQILRAYYGNIRLETINSPTTIATAIGSLPFENNYLLGIAEMPSDWGNKGGYAALKAQAVAARTYALAYTGWRRNSPTIKKSICTSENCQVYSRSKASNPPDVWRRAVRETRGQILVSNQTQEIISSWYASTAGGAIYSYHESVAGHITPHLWDTTCNNQSCWPQEAYENIAGSPWFYKGWYKNRSGKSCGRSQPWLNQDEMADILNAIIVYQHDRGAISHLSQVDSCWGSIPDTWSQSRLRQEADKYGGHITNINSVSVRYSSGGYTQEITFQTNRGSLTFSGDDFKQIFNLRAPGAIHLTSRLFNIIRY